MNPADVRILVIDDEVQIRDLLRSHLRSQGYQVSEAKSGRDGIEMARTTHPHLVLLDLGLPDMGGLDVLKELRAWTQIPIIILTVADDEDVKVRLLDAGADDYLTKPFGLSELMARMRVGLRHHGHIEATPLFCSGDLQVDLNLRLVQVNGRPVKMTATEFEVLALLVRDPGKVVPQSVIMKKVWGSTHEDQTHYLRIYINQIRKKIEVNPSQPRHILTEPGLGYRLYVEEPKKI